MRLIDADALLDKQECLFMKRHILFQGVTAYTIESAPTIDPETLPIVKELREQLARVTTERDKALRHEHLDELKLCLESSRDINLVYIPRSLAEKVAAESMNLENALSKVTAERDALAANSRSAMYGEWIGTADGYADGELVYDMWECSECGHEEETDDPDMLPHYCPDCGADMRGKKVQDDTDEKQFPKECEDCTHCEVCGMVYADKGEPCAFKEKANE